ncbi:MAG: hypothetical protein JWP65_1665 [Ramlibacter sp.]|jgi:hypothetical protein|uniref:EI24 domain-containing protein n=1 Tax=Ramlibacter sp. TaxID=1917967 RepID=UPI00261FCC87|nr:EI24 domain-containing protein [Ramlibacter sp.]MDB5751244.1 hypothetical protein [Ramlibacter sp.]
MSLFLDSFWRAVAYCLHPRIIGLSLLPLLLMIVVGMALGWLYWDNAVHSVVGWLQGSAVVTRIGAWLQEIGFGGLEHALAPVLVAIAVTPLVVVVVLLMVAVLMMPAIIGLVVRRRFPDLERKKGATFVRSALFSLGSSLLAVLALVVSLPLWLVPPLILILPPLIWGWLTYRVMTFDALADHASGDERRQVFRQHRTWLLAMGIATGYLGAAPGIVWASGWFFMAAFPVLVPVAIWIYTLVFAFSSLWFAHYCLSALQEQRAVAQAVRP